MYCLKHILSKLENQSMGCYMGWVDLPPPNNFFAQPGKVRLYSGLNIISGLSVQHSNRYSCFQTIFTPAGFLRIQRAVRLIGLVA